MFLRRLVLALASLAVGGIAHADAPPVFGVERTIPSEVRQRSDVPVHLPQHEPVTQSAARRFTLGAVNVDGATIFSQQQLSRHFEPYLATEIDQTKLVQIADAITRQYRRHGYILSYATVPTQSVEAGMVRLQVVEGRVGAVEIVGAGSSTEALKELATPLLGEGPLKRGILQRTLGLMRDFPGIRIVDVALVHSDLAAGIYRLKITVVPERVRAFAYFDNRGIAGMGKARLFSSVDASSVVHQGDEIRVDVFGMPGDQSRYLYGQILASTPIGANGLKLYLSASRGNQYLSGSEHFIGRSDTFTAELGYPLLRSRDFSIFGKASLSDSLAIGTAGASRELRDHLRVARVGLSFTSEARTQLLGDIVLSQGLGFRGGTKPGDPLASRPGAGGKFTKLSASAQVTRALNDRLTLRATAVAQYADHPLLSAEEFSLGGNRVGRGFAFNTLTGARGAAADLELGYRLHHSQHDRTGLELFAFADAGLVSCSTIAPDGFHSQSLASAGTGIRFILAKTSVSLESAVPLSGSRRHSPRLFVTLFRTF